MSEPTPPIACDLLISGGVVLTVDEQRRIFSRRVVQDLAALDEEGEPVNQISNGAKR